VTTPETPDQEAARCLARAAELEAEGNTHEAEAYRKQAALARLAISGTRGFVVTTDPLGSGDSWLDAAYGRLVEAAKPKGKTRVVKVGRTDLGLILSQFRILVEAERRRAGGSK